MNLEKGQRVIAKGFKIPEVDTSALGQFDYRHFVLSVYGDRDLSYLPIDDYAGLIRLSLMTNKLTAQERFVLQCRMRHLTLQAIGDMVGRTKERIRSIEAQGLRKLRHPSNAVELHSQIQEDKKRLFCEMEKTDEQYEYMYKYDGKSGTVILNHYRCSVCGRRDDEGDKTPFCNAKRAAAGR